VTPGPVFTTATFIGYVLHGWSGAMLATLGIFAPGFLFVACSQPLIPRLRASAVTSALLDGVVVASLGLMAAVTWNLFRSTIVDPNAAVVAAAAALLLLTTRLNSTWLVLAGGVIGAILRGGA
jgi:chromate transporter